MTSRLGEGLGESLDRVEDGSDPLGVLGRVGGHLVGAWMVRHRLADCAERSGPDELNMSTGHLDQVLKVIRISADDHIAVRRQDHDCRIDHVGCSRSCEELTCGSPELLIEGANLDADERLRETGLAWPTAPHLADDSAVGDRQFACDLRRLEPCPHRTFVPVERDERPGIEHEAHANLELRLRPPPRTTTACVRSARCWAAISAAVISPNSRS